MSPISANKMGGVREVVKGLGPASVDIVINNNPPSPRMMVIIDAPKIVKTLPRLFILKLYHQFCSAHTRCCALVLLRSRSVAGDLENKEQSDHVLEATKIS